MSRGKRPSSGAFEAVNPRAAGIDVGDRVHFVAVPDPSGTPAWRKFDSFTQDLHRIADWLEEERITTVALESTGVYWIPLFEVLESRGFTVCLVDTRRLKSVPGRKTDVKDCQWLQQLHTYGLLQSAFRPDEEVTRLRTYLRQREMLIRYGSDHIQHMQKALQQMNIKLSTVLSDITGTTGMAILQAILNGERDPVKLAQLRNPRCKNSEETIAKSLEGHWRADHLFELRPGNESRAQQPGLIVETGNDGRLEANGRIAPIEYHFDGVAKLIAHMMHTIEVTGDVTTEQDGTMKIAGTNLKMVSK